MNIKDLHQHFLASNSITTDTRKITKNAIYFALKGDNFNGNKFANDALKKGAKLVVIDEDVNEIHSLNKYIKVKNVLSTLQELARFHREYLNIPIIALTGSNGKTTTKELINVVLQKKYKTTATLGNLNNHIGVPLTLLAMNKETEIGIVEMGANHKKEIEFLCNIAKPNYGYITNFGKAHLEGFGGIEGVIEGKSELYTYIIKNQDLIFYNLDDSIQAKKMNLYNNTHSFSESEKGKEQIKLIEADPIVKLEYNNTIITSNLIGAYNFTNLSAAITIGRYFNIDTTDIKNALEDYSPTNNRSQIINKGTNTIILDAYNANPTSMTAALTNLSGLNSGEKTAILGDMFELGETSMLEHQSIVNLALSLNIDNIIIVGEHFYNTNSNVKSLQQFKTFEDLKDNFNFEELSSQQILIKGSRGMALERVLELL